MDDFDYESEVSFVDVGVPTLVYRLRAWSPETGELLHLETGLWRSDPEGNLAVSIALPRVTELAEGQIVDGHIELTSRSVSRATGGAGLVAVRRVYDISGSTLTYEVKMATLDVSDLTRHLRGRIERVAEASSTAV
jgi:hypothetical protein